ncbi:hypothetical protein JCM11641_004466 [Rhodosporidiobolus odoratus]
MARSDEVKIECPICNTGKAPDDAATQHWVTMTSCGHMYHEACIAKWIPLDANAQKCIYKCPDRHISFPANPNSRRRIPVPMLRLFIPENGNPPSSDAIEASQSQFYEKTRGPNKGKERAVVEEEDEEVDQGDDMEEDEGESARADESELERLRRELRETRNAVRDQRTELNDLKTDYDALQVHARALEGSIDEREVRITALQAEVAEHVEPEQLREQIADLEEALQDANADAEEERERLARTIARGEAQRARMKTRYELLDGDYREAAIKRDEYKKRLEEVSESGQRIKALRDEMDRKDREILQFKGQVDKANKERDDRTTRAHKLIGDAQDEARRLERDLEDERRRSKAAQGGNAEFKAKNEKLRKKLKEWKAKKGTVVDDDEESEAEDDLYAAPAPPVAGPSTTTSRSFGRTSSRTFARTTSSRSRASPSPSFFFDDDPAPQPAFTVNNNSRLLGSPSKHKRSRSVMDEDAYDISAGPPKAGDEESQALPTQEEEAEDDDSDIEFFEPISSTASHQAPLTSHPSLANTRTLPSSATTSSTYATGPKRPAPFSTLASTTQSTSAWGGNKKPALSQSKADKHLPVLWQGTLDFGPKSRKKALRKLK